MLASTTHQSKRPNTSSYKTKMVEAAASRLRRGWQYLVDWWSKTLETLQIDTASIVSETPDQTRLSSQYWGPLISQIPQRISAWPTKTDKGTLFMELTWKLNILKTHIQLKRFLISLLARKKGAVKNKKSCENTEQLFDKNAWHLLQSDHCARDSFSMRLTMIL